MLKLTVFHMVQMLALVVVAGCGAPRPSGSRTADDQVAAEAVSVAKIGTFNMLRLGHGEKDMARLVALVLKAEFHIFAGTEVMTREGAETLLTELREQSGQSWKLLLSRTANGESSYREFLSFFYRDDVIRADLPDDNFCDSDEAAEKIVSACFARDEGDADGPWFDRDPFIGHFTVGGRRLALIAVHLLWGGSDSESVARRLRELDKLRGIMGRVRALSPSADVITLGDFNLALRKAESGDPHSDHGAAASNPKMPESFFTNAPPVHGLVNGPTTVGLSSYDHLIYFADNEATYVEGTEKVVTDFNISSAAERAGYKAGVSDHFPVGASFRLTP